MNTRIIEAAKAVALSGEGTGVRKSFKVGALLLEKGRVVSARTNSYKTHPYLSKFSQWPFQHAESSCLIHHGIDRCEGLDMVVVRVANPNNQLTMAKPCPVCEELLRRARLRRVYYSDWNGEIKCL